MHVKNLSLAAKLNVIRHAEKWELQLNVYKMSDLARPTVQRTLNTRTKQGMWSDSGYFRDFRIKQSTVYLYLYLLI